MQHKGNQRVEDGEKNEEAWKAWMTCWESEKQKFEFIKLLLKENENNCNYFQVRKWVNSWKNWLRCSLVTASPKSYSKSAAAANSLQSRLTLCHPTDGSPPGSHVPEILQARTLEWVAISFSNAWKRKVKGKEQKKECVSVRLWGRQAQKAFVNG